MEENKSIREIRDRLYRSETGDVRPDVRPVTTRAHRVTVTRDTSAGEPRAISSGATACAGRTPARHRAHGRRGPPPHVPAAPGHSQPPPRRAMSLPRAPRDNSAQRTLGS